MARLSYGERKSLPTKDFAIPGKRGKHGEGKAGKGAYPIPDKAHARNALARVSQFGSPSEKKEVRAAVHRKFPSVGEAHHDGRAEAHHAGHGHAHHPGR